MERKRREEGKRGLQLLNLGLKIKEE